jgi:hypothetical protein
MGEANDAYLGPAEIRDVLVKILDVILGKMRASAVSSVAFQPVPGMELMNHEEATAHVDQLRESLAALDDSDDRLVALSHTRFTVEAMVSSIPGDGMVRLGDRAGATPDEHLSAFLLHLLFHLRARLS